MGDDDGPNEGEPLGECVKPAAVGNGVVGALVGVSNEGTNVGADEGAKVCPGLVGVTVVGDEGEAVGANEGRALGAYVKPASVGLLVVGRGVAGVFVGTYVYSHAT